MKAKLIMPALLMSVALGTFSCSKSDEGKGDTDPNAISEASRQELESAISDRDQLLSLMNDIQQGLDDIKNLEHIVSVDGTETPDQRAQVKRDIEAIKTALQERQTRLDELEKKLSSSNLYSDNLKKTVESLRAQIDRQTEEITRLNGELAAAKDYIAKLDTKVDSLNSTVTSVTDERDAAREQTQQLGDELNTCYIAIGSTKELKDHKILESGFLRKTKIMKGDFDQSFFTVADKRKLSSIPLHSKKAQIMTNQPEGSYILNEQNGQKVLTITNPEKFWSLSNYLVVKID